MAELLTILIITILAFLISALPLYLAVKFMGGKTTLVKTALISLAAGIIIALIKILFKTWGSIIAFIMLIAIYKSSFKMGWIHALLAWFLQFVFIAVLAGIALVFLGVGIAAMLL